MQHVENQKRASNRPRIRSLSLLGPLGLLGLLSAAAAFAEAAGFAGSAGHAGGRAESACFDGATTNVLAASPRASRNSFAECAG